MPRSINQLNQRLTERISPGKSAVLAGFVTALVLSGYFLCRNWMGIPPHHSGDEPDYVSIGWEMSQSNGYRRDFSDPTFREFYRQYHQAPPKITADDGLPDTTRPPLFPTIIAILNTVNPGLTLWPVRAWNILCLSIVCGLVVRSVAVRFGVLAGLLAVPLYLGLDLHTRLYGRSILTEATSTLLVAFLAIGLTTFCGIARYFHRVHLRSLCWIGLWITLAIFLRSSFLLWVPIIFFGLIVSLIHRNRPAWFQQSARTVTLLGSIIIVGYLPWAIRNIVVTGEFLPTGTQGSSQLSAAYGDAIWNSRGVWVNLEMTDFYSHIENQNLTQFDQRLAKARFSRVAANDWIENNPLKAMALPFMKIGQSVRPHSFSQGVLQLLVLLGLWSWRGDPLKSAFLILIAACLTAIGATWSVEGRFLVPLHFVWHCLAAVGLSRCLGLNLRESPQDSTVG